ncbi:sensor histidine kinase [Staphylococcus marylandisciuri]|nr:sensor histidine kinase [Staphylococcus marylandisciuri]
MTPEVSLFFFYSAFFIPFIIKAHYISKETITLIIAMIVSEIITFENYSLPQLMVLSLFYIIILLILFGNFKLVREREMKEELEAKNEHINVLITEQERNRISQDLHDTLGHVFSSLSLKSELAMKLIDIDPDKAKEEIQTVNQLSKDALNKVRSIINDLKIQSFEDEVKNIETLLTNIELKFDFINRESARTLNPTKQAILSMILREAVNNVIKHSQATNLECSLQEGHDNVCLTIHDNGRGLEQGVHLTSLEERVSVLNGTLEKYNQHGLKLIVTIPRGGKM